MNETMEADWKSQVLAARERVLTEIFDSMTLEVDYLYFSAIAEIYRNYATVYATIFVNLDAETTWLLENQRLALAEHNPSFGLNSLQSELKRPAPPEVRREEHKQKEDVAYCHGAIEGHAAALDTLIQLMSPGSRKLFSDASTILTALRRYLLPHFPRPGSARLPFPGHPPELK
jgi:hypothetical protein